MADDKKVIFSMVNIGFMYGLLIRYSIPRFVVFHGLVPRNVKPAHVQPVALLTIPRKQKKEDLAYPAHEEILTGVAKERLHCPLLDQNNQCQ